MRIDRALPRGVAVLALMLSACIADEPTAPPPRVVPVLRPGALKDASALVQQAMRGVRVRGEQDDMLRREAAIPGFGGFYIDSLDHMVVYMKRASTKTDAAIREVLVNAYSKRREPRIQSLMPSIANARVVPGDFTLSELIAIENRISQSTVGIPGFTGVGTSLINNRVVVGFLDRADVDAGLSAIQSMGIPATAIVGEVWGPITISSSFDQYGPVRPTRGGLRLQIHNSTQYPWINNSTFVNNCSLNFNARWWPAGQNTYTDYMITAAHCVNEYRAMNGVTGDTVFQPRLSDIIGAPPLTNAAGFVAVNAPWQGPGCGTNPRDGSTIDYCIDADVMLIRAAPGISMDRRLATSVTQGYNGNPGSMQINNYYPIQSVMTPEWVSIRQYGVAKSGYVTGTTSGQIQLPVTQVFSRICWPNPDNCPNSTGTSGGVQVAYYEVAKVLHAGWGQGDSGGVVFAGSTGGGSPYVALGLMVAGQGAMTYFSTDVVRCTAGTGCSFFFVPWAAMEQSVQTQLGSGTLNPVTNQ